MIKKIEDIQYITRDDHRYSHVEQIYLMYKNGIKWVQLRMKNSSDEDIFEQAKEGMMLAQKYNSTLILNDAIHIAKEVGAHGVHLGLSDMPADEARGILGGNCIIGGTANTLIDVKLQIERGVDYVGLGPFRFTETKKNLSPVIGIDVYKQIIEELEQMELSIPLIAVGGITMNDIPLILDAGMHGVAISGALFNKFVEFERN